MELKIHIENTIRIVCGLNEETTVQDIIIALAHSLKQVGRFYLIERVLINKKNNKKQSAINDTGYVDDSFKQNQSSRYDETSLDFISKRNDDLQHLNDSGNFFTYNTNQKTNKTRSTNNNINSIKSTNETAKRFRNYSTKRMPRIMAPNEKPLEIINNYSNYFDKDLIEFHLFRSKYLPHENDKDIETKIETELIEKIIHLNKDNQTSTPTTKQNENAENHKQTSKVESYNKTTNTKNDLNNNNSQTHNRNPTNNQIINKNIASSSSQSSVECSSSSSSSSGASDQSNLSNSNCTNSPNESSHYRVEQELISSNESAADGATAINTTPTSSTATNTDSSSSSNSLLINSDDQKQEHIHNNNNDDDTENCESILNNINLQQILLEKQSLKLDKLYKKIERYEISNLHLNQENENFKIKLNNLELINMINSTKLNELEKETSEIYLKKEIELNEFLKAQRDYYERKLSELQVTLEAKHAEMNYLSEQLELLKNCSSSTSCLLDDEQSYNKFLSYLIEENNPINKLLLDEFNESIKQFELNKARLNYLQVTSINLEKSLYEKRKLIELLETKLELDEIKKLDLIADEKSKEMIVAAASITGTSTSPIYSSSTDLNNSSLVESNKYKLLKNTLERFDDCSVDSIETSSISSSSSSSSSSPTEDLDIFNKKKTNLLEVLKTGSSMQKKQTRQPYQIQPAQIQQIKQNSPKSFSPRSLKNRSKFKNDPFNLNNNTTFDSIHFF